MSAFLRVVGLLNAAAWFGTAVLVAFAVEPAAGKMGDILRTPTFAYFSAAIAQFFLHRFGYFQIAFASIALLHLAAERLYLGRWSQKSWFALLFGLLCLCLVDHFGLQPRLTSLNTSAFSPDLRPEQHRAAHDSYRIWHGAATVLHLFVAGGLAIYLWRVANPQDSTRFVAGTSSTFQRSERL